jgi:hypothetical protein
MPRQFRRQSHEFRPEALLLALLIGFALGLACLKARDDAGSPAGQAVTYAITCYNVLAALLIAWAAAGLGLGGLLLWGAGAIHAALGVLFVAGLAASGR